MVSNGTTTTALGLCRDHLTQHWTFDNADNMFSNSVGTVTLSVFSSSGSAVCTNDAKIGAGALFMNNGIKASRNVLDGKSPFTIMFWTKRSEWTANQHTLIHVGKKLPTNGAEIQNVNNYIRLSYGNSSNSGYSKLYFWENHIANATGTANTNIGTADRWNHVALTCRAVEQDGAVTSNGYTEVVNGVAYKNVYAPQTDFAPDDYFLFGNGWHYEGGQRSAGKMFIDEIMIFDKALSTAEINAIKDLTQPVDFSANWHMTKGSGTLDIPGVAAQNVTGYGGTVTTSEGLVLAPASDTTYAGVVSGASLTLDAAPSSVTQTIAGANSYVGETHVKTGVLEVNPMAAFPSLETTLVAYWPCDTLSSSSRMLADMSGNGNHLYPYDAEGDATIDAANCIVDGALYLPQSEDAGKGFSRNTADGILEGFESGQDNSFTLAFWMRVDEAQYREGPFSFAKATSARLNVKGGNRLFYFGDNGEMYTGFAVSSADGPFANGKWRHIAISFDASKADGTENCFTLYTNGYFAAETSQVKQETKHAAARFHLGYNCISGEGIKGAFDDVVMLKGVSATDVAALYNWRRGAHEADGETSVLPDTTRVVVDAGATLFIKNANERVRSIAGAGTIHIAEGSSLYARSRKDFTGTIVGGGAFRCPGFSMVVR